MNHTVKNNIVSVIVPNLGTGTQPIQLLRWLVSAGDSVIPGERIAELLVENVVFHLDAPCAGTLRGMKSPSVEPIEVGAAIARIEL